MRSVPASMYNLGQATGRLRKNFGSPVTTISSDTLLQVADFDLDQRPDFLLTRRDGWVFPRFNSPSVTSFAGPGERRLTYDPVFQQLTSLTDELGRKTLYEVDPANGNTLSITRVVGLVDAGSSENDDIVTRTSFTPRGLPDLVTDSLGRVTDYDYDDLGHLTRITDAKGTCGRNVSRVRLRCGGQPDAAGQRERKPDVSRV